ncbi:MAG: peptidase M48 Ste24p [Phycisphaerae bacterium]|nr:peptidase M48 Ste24p [Phycisphaerae bacterium]MBM91273.1 peptidase M48 Ste24p [Phycisphaerae bacterium]
MLKMPRRLIQTLGFVLLGVAMLSPIGCTTNPATGERILTLYSWEDEKEMGASAAAGLADQFGGEVEEAIPSDYVRTVGMKLTTGVEQGVPDLDWEFTLLNTDVINAFALPGGKIFFTRGLAERLTDEAEMAGVLGHEIGHVTARHGNQRISTQIGFNALLVGAAVAVGVADEDSSVRSVGQVAVPGLAIGGNLVLLKYGRDDESEADMLGMRYMARAGYDPSGQLRVMQVLQEASSGGGGTPEWLSTHPFPETRIERIQQILREEYPDAGDTSKYVVRAQEYRDRMLTPLSQMPPAPKTEATSLLDLPALWCGECRAMANAD